MLLSNIYSPSFFPVHKWPTSLQQHLSLTQVHFSTNSLFFNFSMWPDHLKAFLLTHITTPHFTPYQQLLRDKLFLCSYHLIFIFHMPISNSSFLQHTPLTAVPCSKSTSLIQTSTLGEYSSLCLPSPPWTHSLHYITFTSASITVLSFTTLSVIVPSIPPGLGNAFYLNFFFSTSDTFVLMLPSYYIYIILKYFSFHNH